MRSQKGLENAKHRFYARRHSVNVRFQIEVNGRLRKAEVRFGTQRDLQSLARWQSPKAPERDEAILDALEYGRLASKRWRYYRSAGATVASLKELRNAIQWNPKAEVAMIFVAHASWPPARQFSASRISGALGVTISSWIFFRLILA